MRVGVFSEHSVHLYLLKNFQYPNKTQRNRAGRKGRLDTDICA